MQARRSERKGDEIEKENRQTICEVRLIEALVGRLSLEWKIEVSDRIGKKKVGEIACKKYRAG